MINLAFSPCPNDTFIFYALVHGKVDTEGMLFDYRMYDVETLNQMAFRGETDMSKISFHAFLYLEDRYALLDCGSALGFGNGPLLIASREFQLSEVNSLRIVVPGEYTTAHLLFRIAFPQATHKKFIPFSEIEGTILSGQADAGIIIHENRFTYERKGLIKLMDLGEYWETMCQSPIPLGGIVVRKSLGYEMINKLNRILYRSLRFAFAHPEETMDFVRANAREMEEEVMLKHIGLYVNEFSLSLGTSGKEAIARLFQIAREKGINNNFV